MPLTIVAKIIAAENKETLVRAELEKLVPVTRAEEGCLQYDLHQDTTDPRVFLFFENWENRDLWQAHMNAAHLAAYMEATDGAVASVELNEMNRIA